MGNLPDNLPKLLIDAGLEVTTLDGWRTRGRPASTGGFDPVGTLWHHTGAHDPIGDFPDDMSYARWLFLTGRPDLPAPLCQLSVSAEGRVFVGAAGRANHAGVARASGSVAAGDGNRLYVGVECMNSGTQGFARRQRAAMVTLGAVLHEKVLGTSARAARGHKETSVTGKWDPGKLNMDAFRGLLADKMRGPAPDPASPGPVQLANAGLAEALMQLRHADRLLEGAAAGRKRAHRVADELDALILELDNQLETLPNK